MSDSDKIGSSGNAVTLQGVGSSEKINTLDCSPRVYLNCGRWQGGETDFAVVSGREIVLASWANHNATATVVSRSKFLGVEKESEPTKVKAFFKNSRLAKRGFPYEYFRAPNGFEFVSKDKLLVFIGDCHIHLFREWVCDNFVYKPENAKLIETQSKLDIEDQDPYYTTRNSLASELRDLIDVAMNTGAGKDDIIQVGDLYEIWEVQAMFEEAYDIFQLIAYGVPTINQLEKKIYLSENATNELEAAKSAYHWMKSDFPYELLGDPTKFSTVGKVSNVWPYLPYQKALRDYFICSDDINGSPKTWTENASPLDVIALLLFANQGKLSPYATPQGKDGVMYRDIEPWYKSAKWGLAKADKKVASSADIAEFRALIVNGHKKLNFTIEKDVRERIKEQYEKPGELKGYWGKFTAIQGNHDTEAPNEYLMHKYAGVALPPKSKPVGVMDPSATLEEKSITKLIGTKSNICVEHGHAFDPVNNDTDYYMFDIWQIGVGKIGLKWLKSLSGGYHSCRGWTIDELKDPTSKVQTILGKVAEGVYGFQGNTVSGEYDEGLLQWAANRMTAIFLAQNEKAKKVRLVVMGHTHNPCIHQFDVNSKESRFAKKAWQDKLKSDELVEMWLQGVQYQMGG